MRKNSMHEESSALFAAYRRTVSTLVDQSLTEIFADIEDKAHSCGTLVLQAIHVLRQFTLRGGKRLRSTLFSAAYEACGGQGGAEAVQKAGAALEMLHSGLLIHDDWMDRDLLRRGGATVHTSFRELYAQEHLGNALAILVGDYAFFLTNRLLLSMPSSSDTLLEAMRLLTHAEEEVAFGQILDMHHPSLDQKEIERMHMLKTGSYSVRAPLLLGACFASASEAQRHALDAISLPLGIAFQVCDDLLGTFGDPIVMGKSAAGDLCEGKHTALMLAMNANTSSLSSLDTPEDLHAWREKMIRTGAKAQVEARLDALVTEALEYVESAPFSLHGKKLLAHAVVAFGYRDH